MCGIFCIFSDCADNVTENLSSKFIEFKGKLLKRGPNYSKQEICHQDNQILLFSSSVLWLQGQKINKQPIQNNDSVFVYNGDIFDLASEKERCHTGDTKLFLNILESSTDYIGDLQKLNGPFAFIYLDKKKSLLYFGRDKYGRRSLLVGTSKREFILTSVAKAKTNFEFMEVPSLGIFCVNLKTMEMTCVTWNQLNTKSINILTLFENFLQRFGKINVISNDAYSHPLQSSFKPFIEPDDNFLKIIPTLKESFGEIYEKLSDKVLSNNINKLKIYLANSVQQRVTNIPNFCQMCCLQQNKCSHSSVGILFSGGVDCAVLALLADKFVDKNRPIDLLNVAFSENSSEAPDRQTGFNTLEELKKNCPDRTWNFIEINVSKEELEIETKKHISDLIYPLDTILDESLGCALWFASRGKSFKYESQCRVLLAGMGADELFGGYTRHRAALKKGSWEMLHNELINDWINLPYRNLGRDDRVVSDHGKQLRTPYLDEEVVSFLHGLNCWEKTLPVENLPNIGSKILLRCLAYELGLTNAATLKKRALQFGCRIANSKENGHDKSPRL